MIYDNAGRILTKTYLAASAEDLDYTYDSTTGRIRVASHSRLSVQSDIAEGLRAQCVLLVDLI